jgi:hypothetical protein
MLNLLSLSYTQLKTSMKLYLMVEKIQVRVRTIATRL